MKLKQILKKFIINNIGYKLLAVVFSFLLWVVILNNTDPEYTRTITNIPVKIINEQAVLDGTHVYTIASGETTSAIVTGRRSIISALSADDFLVTADFQQLSLTNAAPIKAELTGDKLRYSGQVELNTKDTSMVINLEDMTSRQMQVEVEYRGELPDNIVIDEANIFPKKVTLEAPESIAGSAAKVVVVANAQMIKSDMEMTLKPIIKNANGSEIKQEGDVSLDTQEALVEFKVSNKKDIPIVVNVSGRLEEGLRFEGLELSQDYTTVKGPAESVRSLNRVVIPYGVINLSELKGDYDFEIDLTPYLPEDVTVYGESPMIMVTVKISEEETVSLPEQETETETVDDKAGSEPEEPSENNTDDEADNNTDIIEK